MILITCSNFIAIFVPISMSFSCITGIFRVNSLLFISGLTFEIDNNVESDVYM